MKRTKLNFIDVLEIAVLIICMFLPHIFKGKTLYLFGNFIPESIFWVLWWLPFFAAEVVIHIKSFKEYTAFKKIFYTLLSCGIAIGMVYITVDEITDFSAKEEINLPDGNKIVLYEKDVMQYDRTNETAIKVYKVKGIIANKIGYCWESRHFDDYCLKENKWEYTYDEADKKLTLILRYDKPKDEDGVDIQSEEFTLE